MAFDNNLDPHDLIDPIRSWSRIIVVAMLVLIGWFTNQRFIHWDVSKDLFLRLSCALVVLVLACRCAKWADGIDAIERRTNWWDVGATPDKPTWEDVRLMTIGSLSNDPVVYQQERRVTLIGTTLKSILAYLIIMSLAIEALSIVAKGSILELMFTDGSGPWTKLTRLRLDSNLTAFLALLAAAVSIYFTYRQLQAKVKADSRQAWIDKLRAHIAHFIALLDEIHYAQNTHQLAKERIKLTSCRLEMELMLNPSEKDHRLLMFLSLKLAFFDVGQVGFAEVHDVEHVVTAIGNSDKYDSAKWAPLLDPIPDRYLDTNKFKKAYGDLIGYTMRLAHVVLKREWERVKATR